MAGKTLFKATAKMEVEQSEFSTAKINTRGSDGFLKAKRERSGPFVNWIYPKIK